MLGSAHSSKSPGLKGRKLKYFLWICFAWFTMHVIVITVDGLNDNPIKSDYAVILGTTVLPSGIPSDKLKARLDQGLKLYQDSLVSNVFVSGGFGKEGHYEGTKMAQYLIQQGVLKNDISVDNGGNNTRLTAVNFKQMHGTKASVIVVSQFFHLTRCKLAFKQIGIDNSTAVHAMYFELRDLYSLFREFFGYYKYLFFY